MTDILQAVRWGAWFSGGVLLLILYRSEALAGSGSGDPVVQRAGYLASVGAWAATACLLAWPLPSIRQRRWTAGTLIAVTLGATAAIALAVPATLQHTPANWAAGANGWLLLAIAAGGLDRPVVPWLTLPVVFAMAAAVPAGPFEVVLMTSRALGILGLQVPIALAARAIERSAREASALGLVREAIRTEQLVSAALHDDRLGRSRQVAAAVEPVLASLAGTSTGPDPDDTLRERSGVAAARVRRLLAEWHRTDGDPLGGELTSCLDDAQAAGTRVEVAVHTGSLPLVLRRAAGDVVREITRRPTARLRLTAVRTPAQLSLSIVARTGNRDTPITFTEVPAPLAIRTTTAGETLWVELTCPV